MIIERLTSAGTWKRVGEAETLAEASDLSVEDAKGMNRIGRYRATHEAGVVIGLTVHRVGLDFFTLTDRPEEGPVDAREYAIREAIYETADY